MNISVQAAYFACSGTLENQIQLTRVVERTMFSSGYRIASASDATASNANAQEASPANASASNAINQDEDENAFCASESNVNVMEASPANASASNAQV